MAWEQAYCFAVERKIADVGLSPLLPVNKHGCMIGHRHNLNFCNTIIVCMPVLTQRALDT